MNNYSNNKPHDPHGFKEDITIKFDVVKIVDEKFLNRTDVMMQLLKVEVPPVYWAGYCALSVPEQLIWEERGDALTKSILFLMNLKNNNTKKDLRLAYSQGNKSAYPFSAKEMARFVSTQYPIKLVKVPTRVGYG